MAIEFRTAITIGGVNVVPGYPALSGLTAGQVLRASSGTAVAFAALIANDLPAVLNASGIRAARSGNADGLWVPWQSGDTVSTLHAGSGNSSNDRIAIYGESYSSEGLRGASTSGIPIFAIRNDTATNSSSSGMRVSHRSSGVIAAGLGVEINFMLQSSSTADMEVARISGVWTDPAHSTRSGDLTFGTILSGTNTERMRVTSAGALWVGKTSGGLTGAGDLDVLGNVAIGGTFTLPAQTANLVYAGPGSGASAVPAFRALVAADMPATAVTAGVYTNANITVDAAGRLTSAATGAVVSIPTSVVGYLPFYGTTTTLTSDAALFWDNTNKKLSVGTSTVGRTLSLNAATNVYIGFKSADVEKWAIGNESTSSNRFVISDTTAGAYRFAIDNAGNIGIGTVAQTKKLHIASAQVGDSLYMGYAAPSFVLGNDAVYASATMYGLLALATSAGHYSLAAGDVMLAAQGNSRGNIYINSNYSGTGTTHVIIQPSTGNVGIGTVAPAYDLDVNWSVNSAANGVALRNTNVGSSAYTPLHMGNDTDANGAGLYRQSAANTGYAGANSLMLFTVGAHPIGLVTNNVLRLMVTSAGNVGIGTVAPSLQLETKMSSVYPAFNVQEASSSTRRATIGFGVNGTTANTGWIMGQGLGNNTNKDFYLNDLTAGVTRLFIDASGFVGMGGVIAPAAGLDIERPQAVQLRLASLSGSGTTFMAYSTGTDESLYLMVNRTYAGSTFSRIDTGQPSWTLSIGSQDQDSFKLYRETSAGVLSTLFKVDASGNAEAYSGGTIRAREGTYAAPAGGEGCELASTGGTGYIQSYNRGTSAWRPLNINASSITFGGGVAWGSFGTGGNLTISGRLIPEGCTTGYVGSWGVSSINVNGNLLVSSAVYPGAQGSYYVSYVGSPAGIAIYGNLSSYHDIFPGNNNGTGGSLQATYYFRGETGSGGIRTNGAFVATGLISTGQSLAAATSVSAGTYLIATGSLGTNHLTALCGAGLYTLVFSGLGGYSYTAGGLGYNWGNTGGGSSGQITGSNGGGYIRWHQDGQLHIASMNTSGTVGIVIYAGLNNVGIGVAQAGSARLFSKGIDATSSNNAFICQNSNASNLMYIRNDGLCWAYQAWTISDARVKENVRAIPYGLAHILQLRPTMFDMIGGHKDQLGFIAQEVRKVVPELVMEEEYNEELVPNPMLAVHPSSIIPILVRSVQELSALVKELQDQVATLSQPKARAKRATGRTL